MAYYLLDLEASDATKNLLASTNTLSAMINVHDKKLPLYFKDGQALKTRPAMLVEVLYILLSKLLSHTSFEVSRKLKQGKTNFSVKNETQFFAARTLSLVYVKAAILDKFVKYLEDDIWLPEEKSLMIKLSSLYGLWCLEEHSSSLLRYISNF